jgi:hypothetical protein
VIQNASDVNHSPSVFDGGNQPAFIMAYIEYDKAPGNIGISPTVPNLGKVFPIRVLHDLKPGVERCAPFAVLGGRFPNRLSADDPHEESSQFAKYVSIGHIIC